MSPYVGATHVYVGIDAVVSLVMQLAFAGHPAEKFPCPQTCPTITAGRHVPQVVGPIWPSGLKNAVPWH
jgi:hypothetical protein